MSQEYANDREEDPLVWHLTYWLNILVIARLRGENELLTAIRIEREQSLIPDLELRSQVQSMWVQFQRVHRAGFLHVWQQFGLESEDAHLSLVDIDNMLMDKETKTMDYVQILEAQMVDMVRNSQLDKARALLDRLADVHHELREEAMADAEIRANEARDRLRNDINGVHPHASLHANTVNGVSDYGEESSQAPTTNGLGASGHTSDEGE